jgi:membrane protein implicated in regulation of membrane protease activity
MALLLLAVVLLFSLILIPLGLPGLWVMIVAAVVYNALHTGYPIGVAALVFSLILATVAEVLEYTLAGRYTRRYGGSQVGGTGRHHRRHPWGDSRLPVSGSLRRFRDRGVPWLVRRRARSAN